MEAKVSVSVKWLLRVESGRCPLEDYSVEKLQIAMIPKSCMGVLQLLYVQRDGVFIDNRVPIMSVALSRALPTLAAFKEMLEAGALIFYVHTDAEQKRRNAAFVNRILRGAKPIDLPVEQPTKFELGINLKTAKALGITVPKMLLLRADEVIR